MRAFAILAAVLIFSAFPQGAQAFQSANERYITCPTELEYEKAENLGGGLFAGYYSEYPSLTSPNMEIFDYTGNVMDSLSCKSAKGLGEGLIAVERFDNGILKNQVVNEKGEIVIDGGYISIEPFSEGLAVFNSQFEYGFMDTEGNVVIEPTYYSAGSFSEGLAAVQEKRNGPWKYINKKGETVIEGDFKFAYNFSGNRAFVNSMTDGKGGYIDSKGNKVTAFNYNRGSRFCGGLAMAVVNDSLRAEIIDNNGQVVKILPGSNEAYFAETSAGEPVHAYSIEYIIEDGENGHRHNKKYYDYNGEISKEEYNKLVSLSEGLMAAKSPLTDKYGYVDEKGYTKMAYIFDYCYPFKDGYALVERGGKYGVVESPTKPNERQDF